MNNIIYFLKRFMLPHLGMFVMVLFTGMVAAAASGAGVPFMVKYVFPVVFRGEGDAPPELLEEIPVLQSLEPTTLLILACSFIPAVFVLRGVAMWGNAVIVNILGILIRIFNTHKIREIRAPDIFYIFGPLAH